MDYIKTDEWDEFKTDLNLGPIKEFIAWDFFFSISSAVLSITLINAYFP
jgi:hypothetical protein